MHNLTKIRLFRLLLWITYPICFIIFFPIIYLQRKKRTSLFFFFDRYAIGGAQKVHLDILESVSSNFKTVFFTRKSPNDKLKNKFYTLKNTECSDIHVWCDNLFFRLFSVHYFAFLINRHSNPVVLSSNSTFFYDMLPFIKDNSKKIELLHNFSYGKNGMEFFGLANYKYLTKRMVIDEITQKNIFEQYLQYRIPKEYFSRVELIEFGVTIPPCENKQITPPLKVLYAGRGTNQKRVWLISKIAEYFINEKESVEFTFVGSMSDDLSEKVKENFTVLGEVGESEKMQALFNTNHVIILTSAFEGFPLVVKEGMAHGCVPVVTGLPTIKTHLSHLKNALIIEEINDEEIIVRDGINHLELLLSSQDLLHRISANAYHYAKKNFRKEEFLFKYRNLLLSN